VEHLIFFGAIEDLRRRYGTCAAAGNMLQEYFRACAPYFDSVTRFVLINMGELSSVGISWTRQGSFTASEIAMAPQISQSMLGILHPSRRASKHVMKN
jgi:hypothetical protein